MLGGDARVFASEAKFADGWKRNLFQFMVPELRPQGGARFSESWKAPEVGPMPGGVPDSLAQKSTRGFSFASRGR